MAKVKFNPLCPMMPVEHMKINKVILHKIQQNHDLILLMAEIRRLPVEVGSLSPYLQGLYIPGGARFQPSTVVFDC